MWSFLYFQQEIHAPWLVSKERQGHGHSLNARSPKRWLPSSENQSWRPADQHSGTHSLGLQDHHSALQVSQSPWCYGTPLLQEYWSTIHPLLRPANDICWAVEGPPELRFDPHGHKLWRPSLWQMGNLRSLSPEASPLDSSTHEVRDGSPCITQAPHSIINTNTKDLDEGPRHPDIWGRHGLT